MIRTFKTSEQSLARMACWAALAERKGYPFLISVDETTENLAGKQETRKKMEKQFVGFFQKRPRETHSGKYVG